MTDFDHFEDVPARIIHFDRDGKSYDEDLLQLWIAAVPPPSLDVKQLTYARNALFFTIGYIPKLFPIILEWTINIINNETEREKLRDLCSFLAELANDQKQFALPISKALLSLTGSEKHAEIRKAALKSMAERNCKQPTSKSWSANIIDTLLEYALMDKDPELREDAIVVISDHAPEVPHLMSRIKDRISDRLKSTEADDRLAAIRLSIALRKLDPEFFGALGHAHIGDENKMISYNASYLVAPPELDKQRMDLMSSAASSDMPQKTKALPEPPVALFIRALDKKPMNNEEARIILETHCPKAEEDSQKYLEKFRNGDPYAIIKYADSLKHLHSLLEGLAVVSCRERTRATAPGRAEWDSN